MQYLETTFIFTELPLHWDCQDNLNLNIYISGWNELYSSQSIDVGTEELYNLPFTPLHLSRVAETKVEMFHNHTRAQVQTRTS